MSSLYRVQKTYYIQFYRSTATPARLRRSLKVQTRAEAEAIQADLDDRWAAGTWDPWRNPIGTHRPIVITCEEALEAFLESRRQHARLPRTIETYRNLVGLLLRRSGRRRLSAVRPSDVEAYVWDLTVSAGTRGIRYRHVRTFFRWAVAERYLLSSPLDDIVRPPEPEKLPRNVTAAELRRICAAVEADAQVRDDAGRRRAFHGQWLASAFRFAFFTGLRASEIARLRWRDVDLDRSRLYLYRQKNGREEALPLSQKAVHVLRGLKPEDGDALPDTFTFRSPSSHRTQRSTRSFGTSLSKAFTAYRKKAGIERPITFHGLRHGFCTTLAEAGKSGVLIQAAARHRSLST